MPLSLGLGIFQIGWLRHQPRPRSTRVREQFESNIVPQVAPTPSLPLPCSSNTNTVNERVGSSQPHSAIDSSNTIITGGQFHQISGHQTQIHGRPHTNVVMNLNHLTTESMSGNRPSSPTGSLASNEPHHINLALSSSQSTHRPRMELNRDSSQVSSQNQEITLQKSNDIYARHLTPKGRGFPLWIPEPNQVLHIDYRRTGIRIGDVGIITDDGGFSFLFNICLPHGDPVNPQLLPEHFSPISPPIEDSDIVKFSEFKNGSHLASTSIKRSQASTGVSEIVFKSSASEGAILTMPLGARSERLGNVARFREYAAVNIADWYKFVNGPRGREAENGDIRLVVGFHKTTSWGIATFANQTQQNNCRLRFGPSGGAGLTTPSRTYMWEYSGAAEVRAGPDLEENDELRRDTDPPDVQFENQCLFVRTMNITLSDDVWTDIHSSLSSVHVKSQYPHIKNYSDSSRPYPSNPGTGSSSNFSPSQGAQTGTQRIPGSFYGLQDDDVALEDNPTMFISGPPQSLTAHPSKFLNDTLLAKVPTAKMVITHDDDWTSVITQYDTLPDPHEVAENILASRDVCEENGVVFLQPKEKPNEMPVSTKNESDKRVDEDEDEEDEGEEGDGDSDDNFPGFKAGGRIVSPITGPKLRPVRSEGPPSPFHSITRHPKYYIVGGDLHILVENVYFRVHQYFFERESKYFASKLAILASPGQDSSAILLDNVTAEQFATFLGVFYNPRYSPYDATVADWELILKLSERWDFPEVKNLAIRELEKKDIPDVKRIKLYHENNVDKNVLIPHYAALCEREAHLTIEEGQDLGMETVVMIATCREQARGSPLATPGSSSTSSGAELDDIIRENFHITPEPPSHNKDNPGNPSRTSTSITSPNQDPTGKKAYDIHGSNTDPTIHQPKGGKRRRGGGGNGNK